MTTLEQIAALAQAGFTKAEILAMSTPAKPPEKAPDPAPDKAPEKAPDPAPDTAPEQPNSRMMDETKKLFDAIGMKLDALTASVQKSNMNTGNGTVEETVDNILASIINPGGAK